MAKKIIIKHSEDDKPYPMQNSGLGWYKNGKLHRDNDLPAHIRKAGTKIWYQNGKRHRDDDKPAVITHDGIMKWYKNGLLHRDNGAAVIKPNPLTYEFYLGGFEFDYIEWVKHANISEERKLELILEYDIRT